MWPRGALYRQMRFASANAAPFRIPAGGGAFPPLVKQDEPPPHVKPVAKKKKALWLVLVGPLLFFEPVRFFLQLQKGSGGWVSRAELIASRQPPLGRRTGEN